MILILAMYIVETVLVAFDCYLGWLAYVQYSGSEEQAVAMFITSEDTPLIVINMILIQLLFVTIRLGIADSIMVFHKILYSFCDSNEAFRSGVVGLFAAVAGK
jgi:hypothetical protein